MIFTSVIDTGYLIFEVKTLIDDDGPNILSVYFGGEQLSHVQMLSFISQYGEADLYDEIMTQFRRENEAQEMEIATNSFESGAA